MGSVIAYAPRASVQISGFWPGLEWRRASLTGSARSLSGKLNFRAACDPGSIRASLQGTLGDAATTSGEIRLTLPKHGLSGNLTGDISSIARVTEELAQFTQQH